jgi:hypothetical protein
MAWELGDEDFGRRGREAFAGGIRAHFGADVAMSSSDQRDENNPFSMETIGARASVPARFLSVVPALGGFGLTRRRENAKDRDLGNSTLVSPRMLRPKRSAGVCEGSSGELIHGFVAFESFSDSRPSRLRARLDWERKCDLLPVTVIIRRKRELFV